MLCSNPNCIPSGLQLCTDSLRITVVDICYLFSGGGGVLNKFDEFSTLRRMDELKANIELLIKTMGPRLHATEQGSGK